MKRRFVQINGELHEVALDWHPDPRADHHVMPDISPYRSMIDGSEIGSRSTHRTHLRDHGCIEVGNEVKYMTDRIKPLESPPGLKERYIAAADKYLRRR